jgi:hypothetical protein
VFENRVLRTLFGPKSDEVTEEWRKLHYKELSDLYSLPNIVRVVKSRRMSWAVHVACMGEGRGVHGVLARKPEGKRTLGRPRRRWEDNIKTDLQEVGGGCGDWMELALDRDIWRTLVIMIMNITKWQKYSQNTTIFISYEWVDHITVYNCMFRPLSAIVGLYYFLL